MSWIVRPGHDHNYIDGRTHVHHVHLFNQVTGGEHNLNLLLGCETCPECKRPYSQSDLSTLDPAAEVNAALETLIMNHEAVMDYIRRHGVPVKVGPLHSMIPDGHKITTQSGIKMLHSIRGGK